MPKGDKYTELTNWLKKCDEKRVSLRFEEVREILGFLPDTAFKYSAFWANDGSHSSHHGWMNAGYRATQVSLAQQKVEFVCDEEAPPSIGSTSMRRVHTKHVRDDIPAPCAKEVEEYLEKWKGLENYSLQESALNKLFFETYPKNSDIDDVLVKASVLNDFYGTNIFNVFQVAKHIIALDVDSRLDSEDVSLVDDIADVEIGGKVKRFYSFATKYCSHHRPMAFPIYDSYVDKVLSYYKRVDGFDDFHSEDLKDYARFKSILLKFREFYGLEAYTIKEIDQYLWQLGKDKFPKKYY